MSRKRQNERVMERPYDIITEIKSDNEVKVTGTGSAEAGTVDRGASLMWAVLAVGRSLIKGKNGVVLEGNFTPQEAHNWVSHCCTILKENFDTEESFEDLPTKKVHSVLFQISHEVFKKKLAIRNLSGNRSDFPDSSKCKDFIIFYNV